MHEPNQESGYSNNDVPVNAPESMEATTSSVACDVEPQIISAPSPAPAPAFTGRSLKMSFVKDVSIPDGTVMRGGSAFVKMWKIKNTGSETWPAGCRIVCVNEGDISSDRSALVVEPIAPGKSVIAAVDMITPSYVEFL